MAFFHSFTGEIRQKWLEFFRVNREWIALHMKAESVCTPDGGKRPTSYFILGVVNALEPQLAQLMMPFSKLNPDADTLIDVLDLNFDPDIALGNSFVVSGETYENSPGDLGDFVPDYRKNHSQRPYSTRADDLGEIYLKAPTTTAQMFEHLRTPSVLPDVWGDNSNLANGDDGQNSAGEELLSGVFHESEISRLFPRAKS